MENTHVSETTTVPSENWDSVWKRGRFMDKILELGVSVYNSLWCSLIKKYITTSTVMVELGCGGAVLSLSLAKDLKEYVGIDYSEEAIRLARGNATKRGVSNFSFIQHDVLKLEQKLHNSFDLVWSQGLVEHFPSYEQIIRVHYELVKPGGTVLISVPYHYSYHLLWYLWTRPSFLQRFYPWNDTDVKFPTREDMLSAGTSVSSGHAHVYFLPPALLGLFLGIIILRLEKPVEG